MKKPSNNFSNPKVLHTYFDDLDEGLEAKSYDRVYQWLNAAQAQGVQLANLKLGDGLTTMHYAAQQDDESFLRVLLTAYKGDSSVQGYANHTPLHSWALKGANVNVMRLLLKNGADLTATCDSPRSTPLHFAVEAKNDSAIRAMLRERNKEKKFWYSDRQIQEIVDSISEDWWRTGQHNLMVKELERRHPDAVKHTLNLIDQALPLPASVRTAHKQAHFRDRLNEEAYTVFPGVGEAKSRPYWQWQERNQVI